MSAILRTFLERSAASGADPLSGATGLEVILSRSYTDMAGEEEPQHQRPAVPEHDDAIITGAGGRRQIVSSSAGAAR